MVDFFIVGAPKCGTTSLHRYLDQYECIFMSNPKETNYFSYEELAKDGLYYSENRISSNNAYEDIFLLAKKGQIRGEASVSYLFYPEVPRKIYKYNKHAKIIIVLRDPVERAHSHFLMDIRLGYCNKTFKNIFEEGESHPLHYQQYFQLGLYHDQVEKYLDVFGLDQVLVLLDTDLKYKFEKSMSTLNNFLGLADSSEHVVSRMHNTYKAPKNGLVAFLYKVGFLRRIVQNILPKRFTDYVKSKLFSSAEKPVIDHFFKSQLYKFYSDDIHKLQVLIKRNLSHWDMR